MAAASGGAGAVIGQVEAVGEPAVAPVAVPSLAVQQPTIAAIGNGNCFGCGQPGHIARQCPQGQQAPVQRARTNPNVECFGCGQYGHYADACPSHSRPSFDSQGRRDPKRQRHLDHAPPPAQPINVIMGGSAPAPAAAVADPAAMAQFASMITNLAAAGNVANGAGAGAPNHGSYHTTGMSCRYCGQPHSQYQCPRMADKVCWRCGESGHMMMDCPRYLELERVSCDVCYQRGHLAKACHIRPSGGGGRGGGREANRGGRGRGRGPRNNSMGEGRPSSAGAPSGRRGSAINLVAADPAAAAAANAREQSAEFARWQTDFRRRN